jgi:predicted Ser/Thr protein kinase
MADNKVPETISHYQLGEPIGSGGMGRVYRAIDRRDNTLVAIKLLNPDLAQDENFIRRFEREAHLGTLLRSPYTVQLLQYGFDQDHYFIAMEYVDGVTLKQAMAAGPLEPARALNIAMQVVHALEEAQARGVVHRDIKPDNIILRSRDRVKVLDFGIARPVAGGTLTMTGGFLGTLAYAAPEQATGKADHRTDIYALGATLYHMLIGKPPYEGGLIEALAQPSLPIEPISHLPEAVREVLLRCLDRDPDDRFQSASMLAAALDRCQDLVQPSAAGPGAVAAVPAGETAPTVEPVTERTAPQEPTLDVATAAPQPSGGATLAALALGKPRTGPLGGRLTASRYPLTITNSGDSPLVVDLQAGSEEQDLSYELPQQVTVPPRSTTEIEMKVWPTARRMGLGTERRLLTIAAAGSDGTQTMASTQYDKKGSGLWPVGGVLGIGAAAAIAAAVLMGGGGGGSDGDDDAASAAGDDGDSDNAQFLAATNDQVEEATVIGELPFEDRVETSEATTAADDPVISCSDDNEGSRSVWYEFVAPDDGDVAFDTGGSSYDTVLAFYESVEGEGLRQIGCDDEASAGNGSYLSQFAIKGQTYYIEVAGFGSGSAGGDLVLRAARRLSPIDDFDDAYVLDARGDLPFEDDLNPTLASDAGDDPIPSCGGGSTEQSLWYALDFDFSDTLSVTTEFSGYDTVISVWTGERGDLTEVACNDDFAEGETPQSLVNVEVDSETTYYVMVSAREPGGYLFFAVDFAIPGVDEEGEAGDGTAVSQQDAVAVCQELVESGDLPEGSCDEDPAAVCEELVADGQLPEGSCDLLGGE